MHVYGSVRVIFPVTRTRVHTHPRTVHEWILLIVTIKTVVSVSQRIYNTEIVANYQSYTKRRCH